MKFSARSQYALEAMLALAQSPEGKPIQVRSISRDHGIPVRFLEQIMASLKKAELVKSVRGARGGYLLGTAPKNITVARVLQAVEGPIQEEQAGNGAVPPSTQVVYALWRDAQKSVRSLFEAVSLEELDARHRKLAGADRIMYHI